MTRTYTDIHGLDSDTPVTSRVLEGRSTSPAGVVTVGGWHNLHSEDPVFFRRLAAEASAVAHRLDQAITETVVPA